MLLSGHCVQLFCGAKIVLVLARLAGSLFVARMLTVVTTLRAQNRPVLDYLIHACRAARLGKLAPSLLPADSSTP